MQPDLRGRVALITGSGRGIGRSTAMMLAAAGARVVVTARSRNEIERVADEIRSDGGEAVAIPADLAREDELRRLFNDAGQMDILINNAGVIAPIGPVWRTEPEEWLENIAINLSAVYLACRLALPGMLERGWGRIINVSSGAARGSTAGWSAYSAAKAGLEAFTSVVAQELEDADIRINAVRPGVVDTEMQVEIRGTSQDDFTHVERFRSYKERDQLRHPNDPAQLILWMLSPEADVPNGQTVAIDDPEIAAKVGLIPMSR